MRDEGSGSAVTIAAVIGALLLLGFLLFYVQGAFDDHLYNIGLNWETCGLRHGETVCDEELRIGADTITESTKDGVKLWTWRMW